MKYLKYVVTFVVVLVAIIIISNIVIIPLVDYEVGSSVIVNQLNDSNIDAVSKDAFMRMRRLMNLLGVILALFFTSLHMLYDEIRYSNPK